MPVGLPKFLVGSYKRYKSDTNQFLEWLDRTAKECSPPVETAKIKPSMSQSAKKKAKKNAAEKTPVHMKPLPTDKVALSHFVTLAKVIADSGRQIGVPRLVAVLISRAIALRKRCSAWFLEHSKGETEVNRGHTHFVAVLEEVLRILEEPLSRSPEAGQEQEKYSNNTLTDGFDALANRFSVLDLEEAEEPEEGKKVAEASTRLSNPAVEASQKADIDVFDDTENAENGKREEAVFAVFCLFEDLRRLRDFLKQIWQDYKEQKIDLISAAVTTNTTIDIARQASEEFLEKNRFAITLLKKEMPSDDDNLTALFSISLAYKLASSRGKSRVMLRGTWSLMNWLTIASCHP